MTHVFHLWGGVLSSYPYDPVLTRYVLSHTLTAVRGINCVSVEQLHTVPAFSVDYIA